MNKTQTDSTLKSENQTKNHPKVPKIRFKNFNDTWEQREVRDIANRFDNLRIPVAANLRVAGSTPYYGANGIQDYVEGYTHDGEFVLVAEDGANDLKNYPVRCVNGKIWVNNHAHVLQGINDIADNQFLAYSINQADIESLLVGGSRAKLNAETLMDIELVLPCLREQKSIGEFFSNLDRLITLHQRKHDQLVNIKKSMLEKMFPKNGELVPEVRFAGFTGPWERRKFQEIAVRASSIGKLDGLPRVEYEDIISGTGRLNKDIFSKESQKAGILFKVGDVLYGKLRPYLKNWLLPNFQGIAVGDFWVLQPIEADSSFLYMLIQSRQFDEIANRSTGTKMPRADWKLVASSTFLVPTSIEEQKKIGTMLSKVDDLITLHQRKLEKLKNIKKAMLERMFVS